MNIPESWLIRRGQFRMRFARQITRYRPRRYRASRSLYIERSEGGSLRAAHLWGYILIR